MSEVISFRLSEENPRETQARVVLKTWVEKGYSTRHVITEALLQFGEESGKADSYKGGNIMETVERLANLVNWLEGQYVQTPSVTEEKNKLGHLFLASIQKSAKVGLHSE